MAIATSATDSFSSLGLVVMMMSQTDPPSTGFLSQSKLLKYFLFVCLKALYFVFKSVNLFIYLRVITLALFRQIVTEYSNIFLAGLSFDTFYFF